MAEFLAKDAVLSWVTSSGTTSLTADYRTFSFMPTQDKHEVSASSEVSKSYIIGQKDWTISYTGWAQSDGTALESQLLIGTSGTLTFSPEGTTAGKRKWTFPCIVDSHPIQNWAFNAPTETSINWIAAGSYTMGTN